jgi:multidrug efflux pump subunit AcrA (membrane-fusion protein)
VALHQGHKVWVVNSEERLRFRIIEVARIQGDSVLVMSGLGDGEKVVITPIKSVTDGMKVRTVLVKEENS